MNLLLSATSPDCSLAAVKAPSNASSSRHLIRIYQVGDSTTTLQSTLTHTSKLPLVQLVFLGTSSVLGLFGRQEVVVWDLDRGVVAATLNASEDQNFLALASSSDDDGSSEKMYYILVKNGPKLVIQEYVSSGNKLVRKIKSGRMKDHEDDDGEVDTNYAASLVVTSSYVIVRTKDHGIRVMDKATGKKIGKISIKGLTSSDGEASSIEMSRCIGNSNILVALDSKGDAILYDLENCNEIVRVSTGSVTSHQTNLQLVAQEGLSDQFTLIHYDSLYSVSTGSNKSSAYEKLTQVSTNDPLALFLRSNKVLALIQERSSEYRVRWIDFSKNDEEGIPPVYKLDKEQNMNGRNDTASTRKRNASEIKVLGPGQAGSEEITVKKLKANNEHGDEMDVSEKDENGDENNDEKDLTIAERLRMLTDALDEEENDEENDGIDEGVTAAIAAAVGKTKFKPQKANTESLKELLTQALQSSDDSLLELALSVHDVKIIATSIREMDEDLLVILLGKLTSRLASSPLRAEVLSIWISNCLKRGSFDSNHLAVLRNMLYERIESFSDLLRLEGRLSMMVD